MDRVLALSNRLRAEGVDCRIDQYEQSPAEGWPQWCERQVEQSTFVLVACTGTYLRRFNGDETPQIGLGVTWEGHVITQYLLYDAQGSNTKFIPILFTKEDEQFVPKPLRSATRYQLSDNYDQLYRRLTNQPLISKPALGGVKPMPAGESLPPLPSLEQRRDFQDVVKRVNSVWFFMSHSRRDRDPYLEQFFGDLRDAVSDFVGGSPESISFLHTRSIEAADQWENILSDALRTSRLCVAICSPSYIHNTYCGKEYQVFCERRQLWLRAHPNDLTRVIFPVLWIPPTGELPMAVSSLQYSHHNFQAPYEKEGLKYLMRLSRFKDEYQLFVLDLARDLARAGHAAPLPELPELRPLTDVSSAFEPSSDKLRPSLDRPGVGAPRHDVFISYAKKDKSVADTVCAALEADGIRCWIAPRDILGGVPYSEALIDAIHESRVMILILSSSANDSPQVMREVERAVSNDVPLLPFRIENFQLAKSMEYFVASTHWLDATTPPTEKDFRRLAEAARNLLSRAGRIRDPSD